ncbi:TcpQ domain-containing protein [Photorhabdus heterorhabditis]|uniref:PFGI-1 class ICE element type IV pilus protein PilL2 n=1 Tax=Photorhabdus heterorhabditis TaxID=880156 RepID=UPI001BD2CD95|nr:TcpQ domain-containing protein [Photorhabdus heterorhabditis]MBS9441263.1 pilus assembly protein [Photorhabdus heterorhabditis]
MKNPVFFSLSWLSVMVLAGCAGQTQEATASGVSFHRSHQARPAVSDIYSLTPQVTRHDRYTLVSVGSQAAQREPLNQIINITMPVVPLVQRIGDGLRYLLFGTGYSLCDTTATHFVKLIGRPLPAIQRKMGPIRLSEALQIVAGPAWRIRVDEVNREVCFVLRDEYRQFSETTVNRMTPPKMRVPAPTLSNSTLATPLPVKPPIAERPKTDTPKIPVTEGKPTTISSVSPTQPIKSLLSGSTPVTTIPIGNIWRAETGTTLRGTLERWANTTDCPVGGHWVVVWSSPTDYRIDAPLMFKGNFESLLVQVFDLYRQAEKPLFAEVSRLQCLISVSDKPVTR